MKKIKLLTRVIVDDKFFCCFAGLLKFIKLFIDFKSPASGLPNELHRQYWVVRKPTASFWPKELK
ncbi:hypothetical protein COY25_01100 [Candidatus Uhrbacteria bacterium CG_4_10_14_0_2_um_filter_41_7]|nr:MAG: hypothetical protein COY25_01100 [Candidatus Uhrbacteria bacterium CG_4_10_14_0_2_um_filter_41_7]